MKRIILLLIICLLAAAMVFSCCCFNAIIPPEITPEPTIVLDYVKGVYILRRETKE